MVKEREGEGREGGGEKVRVGVGEVVGVGDGGVGGKRVRVGEG